MDEKRRPNPDELLKRIEAEEPSRGRLKIFLGYAAGVGKTYAMLEAAHQRRRQGVDVVVGYVETHGRVETEGLLGDLEVTPRKQVEYHSVTLPEMDVDAVLARRPALALVDEFAHTNAPGSRHPKRYLDVKELLEAGTDVYTTLNIQHLESLNDVVAQVTGVVVRETIPDSVIDEASEIEVVDLPPDELLARLSEGKVYVPEQAARAIQKFFRKGNLTALREMALRRAAERVDDQMRSYMQTESIPGPWPAGERLLVCISPSPLADRLVRTARRLAGELNAEWFAVYVNDVSRSEVDGAGQERVARALQLAEELGARTRTLTSRSIANAVLAYARKHNVTKVLVGKPLRPRWQEWLMGSMVDRLIHASGDIDIYVISAEAENKPPSIPPAWQPHRPLRRYLLSLFLVFATTAIGLAVRSALEPANLVMIYLLSVVIAGLYLGRGPALLAALASVLAFDFFLIPPYITFAVSDGEYILTFIGLFVVSLVISNLTARLKEQAEASIRREALTAALFELSRDLAAAADLKAVTDIILLHVSQALGGEAVVFLPEGGRVRAFAGTGAYVAGENDLAVAVWSFEHNRPAGLGTDTLTAAPLRCQPLKTARGLVGVLGVRPSEPGRPFTAEQRQVLVAFANQAAVAIERASLAEKAREAELLRATEKLQSALLNSISHDLRTPLVSITGSLSSLTDEGLTLDEASRRSLIENACGEADRLNRLVGNLLDMTRLEAGAVHVQREACDVEDVIGSALEQLGALVGDRPVTVDIAADLPQVPMDFVLISRVLVNVIDNALKYSPPGSPIDIHAALAGAFIEIQVADRGVGIPAEDLARIFDKFYRVQRPESVTGTGLGLAISKGILEAHAGFIAAENRPGGGTLITLALPLTAKVTVT